MQFRGVHKIFWKSKGWFPRTPLNPPAYRPALCSVTTVKVAEYVPFFISWDDILCILEPSPAFEAPGYCHLLGLAYFFSFFFLSALLAGLLLQHTLHASVFFTTCNHSTAPIPVSLWLGSRVVGLSMGTPLLNGT